MSLNISLKRRWLNLKWYHSKAWVYGFLFASHSKYGHIFSRFDAIHKRDRHRTTVWAAPNACIAQQKREMVRVLLSTREPVSESGLGLSKLWAMICTYDPWSITETVACIHCVPKKHVTTFLMISWSRTVRLERFLAHLLLRVHAIDRCVYFPTSPISCSYFTLGNCQDLNISKN